MDSRLRGNDVGGGINRAKLPPLGELLPLLFALKKGMQRRKSVPFQTTINRRPAKANPLTCYIV